jgi:uncharacterized membrane protein YhaH (DUF805 family)
MFGAIRYNLGHLFDFTGRDARQTFWYYVAFLVILDIVVVTIASIPALVGTVGTAMEAAQAGLDETDVQAQVTAQMQRALSSTLWISVAINAAIPLLLVAAFVRRLHDSDKSGWWALVPLATQAASVALTIRMMGAMQAAMHDTLVAGSDPARLQAAIERQAEFASYGLIGWIGPLVVVGFGVLKSSDGPNRYGAEPVRF